jgi:hypothetical protein
MWKSWLRIAAVLLGTALVLGACSSQPSLPRPGTPDRCGNPCAMACPTAFRCDVDAQCVARCTPESLGPGKL